MFGNNAYGDLGGRSIALGPLNFAEPLWEELTGIKFEVVESQVNEMLPKPP